jgi:ABC-type transport system substrate-binding protein
MTRITDADTIEPTRRSRARVKRLAPAATAALAAVILLAACGSSSSSSSSSSGASSSGGLSKSASNPSATLIVNNAVPIATLDPNFTTNDQDPGFDGAMYSTLTQVDH